MIHVGVIFGSRSVEHEISVITAVQAMHAMSSLEGYTVVPLYIDKNGDWFTGDNLLEISNYKNLDTLRKEAVGVHPVRQGKEILLVRNPVGAFGKGVITRLDVVLPILHGSYGEDGTIQGFFETLKLPYGGCGVMAAALTMDKIACKHVLKAHGVPVVDGIGFSAEDWLHDEEDVLAEIKRRFSLPLIVKPSDAGSSVGVSIAHTWDQLSAGIDSCRQYTNRILVENMVQDMREINISVLGDAEELEVSVCEEPISGDEFLSYEDKYVSGGKSSKSSGMASTKRIIPADIPDELRQRIEQIAAAAFRAVDASGVARLDFMIDGVTGELFLNELNTIPGSLSFYLWEPSGVPFDQLMKRLIDLALRKERRRGRLSYSNEMNLLAGDLKIGGGKTK